MIAMNSAVLPRKRDAHVPEIDAPCPRTAVDSLLSDAERAARAAWNATEADLPHGVCLHAAFEACVDADPAAVAVLYGDERIGYGELEARANRLAHHLRAMGVGPESRVGICVERGPRVLEAILGVLKAGGAYVPLDPTYPADRLAHMLETAAVRVLVTEEALEARLPRGARTVLLDRDAAAIAAHDDARPDGGATPENLAYVIFTSGSTGQPKGIALAHRGVMNNLADLNTGHRVGPADRVLLLSSLSFDMSVYETLGILAAGGAVVIPRAGELRDPAAWAALCRRHGVTLWNSAPALLGMLADHAEASPAEAPAGLRLAFLGGDWVPVPLVERVRAFAPAMADFIVMGGATEASIHSIIYRVEAVDPTWRSIPYGVPMANQRAWVLDDDLREVPVGASGELFLGGIGLARGYAGRAGFTAERFLPDPHAGVPGARMYRTGDLARYGADGTIELLGRIDHQVKIRGFRIEPGEIESALRRHPSVERAVVVSRADGGESRLVAYLVPAGGAAAPAPAELRALLRETLPDYMVPSAYVALDRLPLSPNGKVDRKQLPAPPALGERAPFVAPRTPAEASLAAIWAEVLSVDEVGADDDFFALGGHSLLATRVVSRVRAAFGVELPMRALFEAPTVAALAARIDGLQSSDAGGLPAVTPVARTGALPLSFAQERLWFLDRLQPGSAFYNIPTALRLSGALQVAALERALGEVVRRHEALRTTFREVADAPVQVIAPFAGFSLPVEDLSALAAAEREAELRRLAMEEAARPFDLEQGPLFRATLLRLGAEEHVLLICMHHVVGDGWSTAVLFRELSALYGAYRDGRESPLAALGVQYADYAAWQRERLRGETLDRELAYWRERLAGAPALLELPADHPRPAVQTYRGARVTAEISAELQERLQALALREGATLFMVLLGAFQLLLARYGAGDDVVVGSPIAGRTRGEVEALIGFFVNTLVLRTDLSGDPAFREVLRRVRAVTLGAYEHQELPFERLVAELHPERSLSHSPLVQAMFILQNNEGLGDGLPGLRAEAFDVQPDTSKFDLTLAFTPDGDRLRVELEYGTDLFERATVDRMLAHLERLLEAVADDAETPASALALLDGAERHRVLEEWNRTAVAYPRDRGVHALFAEQAARTPGAVALVHGDETITYAELNERANRLAHHLARAGVGPESRVGVCLERGPALVTTLLATLKAGGAYVPLDPGYPAERLALMLADASVAVLVTQEKLRAALPALPGVAVVEIDRRRDEIAAERADDPAVDVGAGGLAYVMYTSGSTGTPKGVAIEHRGIVRLVRGADFVDLGADEVILQAAPPSFDASTLEIWGALLNGGRLVLLSGATPSLEELGRTIARHGVTTLWLTAGLFQAMVEERLEDLGGLRQLLAGGDVLPAGAVRKVRDRFPALRVINGYGPTENTTFTTCYTVADGWRGGPVPIGRPIANTRAYVLDAALRPVPIGVPGELFAAGDGLARGYLGRPALTAERFVPDPFGSVPGARMYRTGDRVRWSESAEVRECGSALDPRGTERTSALTHSRTSLRTAVLDYLGRLDGQVKIRGFRIEPGEIEAALLRHPAVADCLVLARGDVAGGKRLVAYVAGEGADADELRACLRRSLPEYMVPGAFVVLDRLPLTPNGKVDRAALPAPEQAAVERYLPPRTPVEELLAGIWAEVLRRDRVGVDENFFALGGHSLLATRVISRVRAALGTELTVRALFESPTVAELAARVDGTRHDDLPALPAVAPVERTGPLPLSFAQERLWVLHQMEPQSAFYNVPAAWRLRGALDVPALERALGEVVRRHEALRTTFASVERVPVQVIAPYAGFALPVEDLTALPIADRERTVKKRSVDDAARPFDLERGPLFRAALLRLDAGEHLLLICMHHMVCDGWSMGVLFGEIAELYGAFAAGQASPLANLPLQYGDYSVWQREHLSGERLQRQVSWWGEHLAGAPTLLELPTDRPRPAVQSYRGALHRFRLSGALAQAVEALARREGATPYMVLLAAFHLLLARYSRQDEVVVGSPIANRGRPELEGLVGFFVNTIAIRGDLSGEPTFRELVARVRESALGAYAHQEVPFEKLVEELQPGRSLSHNPIFQAFFALLDGSGEPLALPGLGVEPVAQESPTAKFDLSLFLHRDDDGMVGSIEYATDLFDAATAERIAAHLTALLEAIVAAPERRVSELSLVAADERAQVLGAWSGAGDSFPADGTLHARFESAARLRPTATAVTCEDEALTYAELNARANRLARRLRALGVGVESRVGLCAERSAELMVGILAILKAGGAYVPLDPSYPIERLAYMAEDSAIRVVLAQAHLLDRVPVDGLSIVALEEDLSDESGDDLGVVLDPENLAYVIYTSGSTGRPKGVGVTHANVLRLFSSTEKWFSFGERDVWTLFHSYAFDFSVWEMWGALLHGGRLVVVPWDVSRDPGAFRELLSRERVTALSQTPSAFRALAQADERAAEPLDALRFVVFGGEALQFESLRGWLDRYGPARPRLVNMYGITETTVHVTYHAVTGKDLRKPGLGSAVGVPIPDLRTFVLDAAGQPLPVGVPGELCVGGAGPARGYLGRPALTAERFVPDAFSGIPGARLYRSGDLARWMADGTLEYLGRIDQQVKVRGFRIELGEIEAALLAHPSVAQTAVIVRGEGEDAALAAYVVPAAGLVDAAALKDALRQHLPEYMVPSAFVALDRLPLTSNGKLDRRALPEPEAGDAADAEAYQAPRTPTEELLAGIWAEVLRLEHVGADADFFELGGHSLRATQVMARVQETFGVAIPLRALFEGSTVQALAARIDAARQGGHHPAETPIGPADRSRPLPLSFSQERLWFVERLQPGTATYNVPVALDLSGALDVAALERALGEIVRRHETLRTTFADGDGGPVQVVHPAAPIALPATDLSALPADARRAEAERLTREDARRPFDLAAGPLFRAALLRLGEREHRLLLCMHHVVTDGWSHATLLRELRALYPAFARGEASPLAEPAVQYADYAAWQREQLSAARLAAPLAWWRERLAGAPARLDLPTDRPRPAIASQRGLTHTFVLSAELSASLRALARREGATPYMVLLAAWQLLLARYSGQDDVMVGSPIAGRTRPELEGLIGFFVNTLVLRGDLSGDPTFRELLGRVRETALDAFAHQEVPFERLIEELAPERVLGHNPLFQVMFALQNAPVAEARLGDVEAKPAWGDAGQAHFDLTLSLEEGEGGLEGEIRYATDLFDAGTIERMAGHYRTLLEAAAADPARRISALPLLDGGERERLLVDWNASGDTVSAARTVHEGVAAIAAARPDAEAIVCAGERLSYAELNARANRLARHLRRRGVGVETRVGVLLERGLDLPVALLAVMKAGGAYVPLDPSFPPERLAFILADADAKLLITRDALRARVESTLDVVSVDAEAAGIAAQDGDDLAPMAGPDHLAYVIYTSGSTGEPKGSMIPHRAVPGYAGRYLELPEGSGPETWLQYSSLSWDALTLELWTPLLRGARCAFFDAGSDGGIGLEALGREIAARGVTTVWMTASLFNAVLDTAPHALEPLRVVMTGGEALSEPHVRRALERFPKLRLVNGYGPSECTVFSACKVLSADFPQGPVPIGRPVGDRRVYILDDSLQPVPAGVPGELYVGGPAVARGYLGRPTLTAEKFVPDPFSAEAGARLYRTGDRVRWLASGELEFVGRADQQVKVRGFRIEPGEVEAALLAHPAVREATVGIHVDGAGEKRLVAWIVAAEGAAPAAAELREALRRTMPDYMVPSAFVTLDALPLTRNAKVNRAALPAPDHDAGGDAYVAPRTPAEEAIAAVWAEVLGLERVGVRDDFFAVGGHSLRATRVVSRIHQQLGVELPLRALFEAPTVEGLAARVDAARRAGVPSAPAADSGPIVTAGRGARRMRLADLGAS
jgi:amino acid adenylation domain-containing protein